jgi:muramoyltetrapeptide carboxypeptidase
MIPPLISPGCLPSGGTIGIVSPSAGLAELFPHRLERGIMTIKRMGYRAVVAPHARERSNWVSASSKDRAGDLHAMFDDPDINAIACMIGGNHSNQILKYLDFRLIRRNPKIFIGYSDITILHHALAAKAGLRTFYGPCIMSEFGEVPDMLPYTKEWFLRAVTSSSPLGAVPPSDAWTDEFLDWGTKRDLTRPRTLHPSSGYEWWREGKAEAPVWGGAIPTITYAAGTDAWMNPAGMIYFIDLPEGDPGKAYAQSWVDAALANLDNLGVFASICGLIIGRPYAYDDEKTQILKQIIMTYTEPYDYPILYNANIGHASPIITLPLGVTVRLDSDRDAFEIMEAGVSACN